MSRVLKMTLVSKLLMEARRGDTETDEKANKRKRELQQHNKSAMALQRLGVTKYKPNKNYTPMNSFHAYINTI